MPPRDLPRPTAHDWRGRSRPDITDYARRVLAENGNDSLLTVVALLQQTFDDRDRNRELEHEVVRLQPQAGEVRLDGQEAETYRQYKTLGALEAVRVRLTRADQADQADTQRTRDTAAQWAAGLVEPSVPWNHALLARLLRDDGHEVVRQKVRQAAADPAAPPVEVELPYVKKIGEQTAPVPLADYAREHWSQDGLLPALRTPAPDGAASFRIPVAGPLAPAAPRLTPFLPQGSASSAPAPTDVTGSVLRQRYPAPQLAPTDR